MRLVGFLSFSRCWLLVREKNDSVSIPSIGHPVFSLLVWAGHILLGLRKGVDIHILLGGGPNCV